MKGISIIICCYNSAKRLPKTLEYLAKQQVATSLQWEIIVVNNNSNDTTETDAIELWQSFATETSLIVVNEPQPGLSYAREKGMTVAQYDFMLWCDDDNWLCDTYVQNAYDIMQQHPDIGALGGWCDPAFETKKPEWFDSYAKYFAVSKQGKQSGDITTKKGCVYGAGMVLRKSHNTELKALGFKQLLNDRKGQSLSSGGDTEYCYALRLLGYKMWYDERLYFQHFMTDGRLSLDYVSRLRKAMAHSNFMLWPYLDILRGHTRTKKDFLKEALKGIPILFIKKVGALLVGTYAQKEDAKRYLRQLYYRLFKYHIYKQHLEVIKTWKP